MAKRNHTNTSKDQSNLSKDRIAVHLTPSLYSPDGSIGPTVWLQLATACFGWGLDSHISPSPGGSGTPSNSVSLNLASVPGKWHLNLPNGLSWGHKCDRYADMLQSVTCLMGSHSATYHSIQVNAPCLNLSQTGHYSIYLP